MQRLDCVCMGELWSEILRVRTVLMMKLWTAALRRKAEERLGHW